MAGKIAMTETRLTEKLTILRIKRKRTEEPLDALYLEHPKRPRRQDNNRAIFRLAQTIEDTTLDVYDTSISEDLRNRIANLSKNFSSPPIVRSKKSVLEGKLGTNHEYRYRVIPPNLKSEEKVTNKKSSNDVLDDITKKDSNLNGNEIFKVYDAVREIYKPKEPKIFVDPDDPNATDIMDNFIPMLKEYLTISEDTIQSHSSDKLVSKSDDYVYDIYFKSETAWMDQDSSKNLRNIASLAWFDDDEFNNNLVAEDERESDYDYEDQDSNAEDYYSNDYPDEENDYENNDSDKNGDLSDDHNFEYDDYI